jgi:glutamate dehydrogenase/leucine dehydrogenase
VAVDDSLSAILNLAGLTSNEADVVEILRQETDPLKRVVALTSLAESRKQAQTTPAAAGNVLPSGTGATVSEETLETITEQLKVENAKPIKDFEKIKELREKNLELLPKE